jgi:hypothetical protein
MQKHEDSRDGSSKGGQEQTGVLQAKHDGSHDPGDGNHIIN